MLDTDDGARRLGELGIGTNYGSQPARRRSCSTRRSAAPSTWRSERAYPETGGENKSAVHWDLVCDLRSGGSITVDGVELQRDGAFQV